MIDHTYLSSVYAMKTDSTMFLKKLRHSARLDELKTGRFYRDVAIEFVATFLLVFVVGTLSAPFGGKHPDAVHISLAAGLGVAVIVWGAISTSGSHINPSITIAVTLAGHVSIVRGVGYVIAQCLGSYMSILVTKSLTPKDLIGPRYGVATLNPALTPLQGCGMEIILTFFLAFTIYSYVDDERPDLKPCGPLLIGFSVTLAHLIGMPYTSCAINPARAFGPALAAGYWVNHWIYWVGPILGSTLAMFSYDYVIRSNASLGKLKGALLCGDGSSTADDSNDVKGIQANDNNAIQLDDTVDVKNLGV